MSKIHTLISVCAKSDLDIWRQASRAIVKNIDAEVYVVIVPSSDIEYFKNHSHPLFHVVDENSLDPCINYQEIKNLLPSHLKFMTGWYLQQILKIKFLSNLPTGSVGLIWDADTIPLRKLNFINKDGSLNFYISSECHEEYYINNINIANVNKKSKFSFISQCMPYYADDVRALIIEIEFKHKMPWHRSIISSLVGDGLNLFSEYELLGNYLLTIRPSIVNALNKKWSRDGLQYFKALTKLNPNSFRSLSFRYDFIAIEGELGKTIPLFYIKKFLKKFYDLRKNVWRVG